MYVYRPLLIFSLTIISHPASKTAFVSKKTFSKQAIFTVNNNKGQDTSFNVIPSLSKMPQVVVKQAIDKKTAANPNVYPDLIRFDLLNAVDTK
jgi:hypothetical protein